MEKSARRLVSTMGGQEGGRQTGWAWGRSSCRGKQCAVRKRHGILQRLPDRCRVTLRGKLDTYYGLVFGEVTLVASVEDGQGRGWADREAGRACHKGESWRVLLTATPEAQLPHGI